MRVLYNIGIYVYIGLIRVAALFKVKAGMLVEGRRDWFSILEEQVAPGDKYVWVHSASLGEFEQGRPVIECIRKRYPGYKIIVTFFSPSGYEVRKDYKDADIVCYMPSDTPGNARRFVALVNPEIAIIVKYEFWFNFIDALSNNGTSLYLISGIFRKQQHFFKWYGGFFRNILKKFTAIFVQDENSYNLLKGIEIENVIIAGDTRFDRVMEIAGKAIENSQLCSFKGEEPLFMCGSSWIGDEAIITQYINRYPDKMKWVFAPHEIYKANLERLEGMLETSVVRYSKYSEYQCGARVMIIDNIGMLSSAYQYAKIACIGGGFGKGIHNILEAACWGIPVLFGPNHSKFREAIDLKKSGGAVAYADYSEFETIIEKWLSDDSEYQKAATAAKRYVDENSGATATILNGILKQ